jgi:hypothetical protein
MLHFLFTFSDDTHTHTHIVYCRRTWYGEDMFDDNVIDKNVIFDLFEITQLFPHFIYSKTPQKYLDFYEC